MHLQPRVQPWPCSRYHNAFMSAYGHIACACTTCHVRTQSHASNCTDSSTHHVPKPHLPLCITLHKTSVFHHQPSRRLPLGFGIPLVPHIPHHHTAEGPIGPDAALQRQIKQSQRVGTLLLKSEEDEVAAINQRADELIQQYRYVTMKSV